MPCYICGQEAELCINATYARYPYSIVRACDHAACTSCLHHWVRACDARWHHVPCFVEGCGRALPLRLVDQTRRRAPPDTAAPPELERRVEKFARAERSASEAWATWAQTATDVTQLLRASKLWDFQLVTDARPNKLPERMVNCPQCHRDLPALVVNGCGHAACPDCWSAWSDRHLPEGCSQPPGCLTPGCDAKMRWGLLRGVCAWRSEAAARYVAELDDNFRALDKKNRCAECGQRAYVQPANTCGHSACFGCWINWAEVRVEMAEGKCVAIPCISECCNHRVQGQLWRTLCKESEAIERFDSQTSETVAWFERAAQRGVSLDWQARSTELGPVCELCHKHSWALVVNPACGHGACPDCWVASGRLQVEQRRRSLGCPACETPITQPETWSELGKLDEDLRASLSQHDRAASLLQKTRAAGVAVVEAPGARPGPHCPMCGDRQWALLRNRRCGHAACINCWAWNCQGQRAGGAWAYRCLQVGCCEPMELPLQRRLDRTCQVLRDLDAMPDASTIVKRRGLREDMCKNGLEVAQLGDVEAEGADAAPCGCESLHRLHLRHSSCGHSACVSCWARLGVRQMAQRRVRATCPGCPDRVQDGAWAALAELLGGAEGAALEEADGERKQALAQMQRLGRQGVELQWAPTTSEQGPECPICGDRAWALLRNSPCQHGACQACWIRWAEEQVERCMLRRKDVGRCFAPSCRENVAVCLQASVEACSDILGEFGRNANVRRRRRLRDNALYPAEMQIDCPDPACWGLGYLGFETVMCFACERQWVPEDARGAPVPTELDVEEVMGVKVKRCPQCREYIEKNGGCDHMTCKCGYEFWWTTLQPYRS